jgi:hypothetical protein
MQTSRTFYRNPCQLIITHRLAAYDQELVRILLVGNDRFHLTKNNQTTPNRPLVWRYKLGPNGTLPLLEHPERARLRCLQVRASNGKFAPIPLVRSTLMTKPLADLGNWCSFTANLQENIHSTWVHIRTVTKSSTAVALFVNLTVTGRVMTFTKNVNSGVSDGEFV